MRRWNWWAAGTKLRAARIPFVDEKLQEWARRELWEEQKRRRAEWEARSRVSPGWGRDFRDLRVRRRMTQAQVAARAGVSQAFVSRFELGRDIRVGKLERLYGALGVVPRIAS